MKRRQLSIFVPVYNEEKNIRKNMQHLFDYLSIFNIDYEIVIVNDSSTDMTKDIAKCIAEQSDNIHVLDYEGGPSRRENLAEAFKNASYDNVMFMDADGATDLGALPNLINQLDTYPIVIGSRYLKHSKIDRKMYRMVISFCYNTTIRFLFKSKIKDHQCGFKAFKKDVLLKLVKEMGYDDSMQRGWFWDTELLVRAQLKGIPVKEIPVIWVYGEKSSFSFRRELRLIRYMFKFKESLK